jgi:chorismate mutase
MVTVLKFPIFVGVLIWGTTAQGDKDAMQALVQTSAQRLQLARQVALAKWDSGANVEDSARENQVIESAARYGETKGLDPAQVRDFFKAQIEANKVIQYSLLSGWLAAGNAPAHPPVDLAKEIRPQLDQIQSQLLDELEANAPVRSSQDCRANVAHAVAHYVAAQGWQPDSRDAVALERAMAATCSR